jgi:hypothetical protein
MSGNRLCFAILACLTIIVFNIPTAFSQSQRRIEWPKVSIRNSKMRSGPSVHMVDRIDQVEIQSIQAEGQTAIFGQGFDASDDWLRELRFRVKNVSGERLSFVQITLIMPEINQGKPELPFVCVECGKDQKPIEPGAELELTLPPPIYTWAKDISKHESLASITRAQILYVLVRTSDGSMWSSDCVKTADPRNACRQPKQ